ACDRLDGVADGILNDPRQCHFDAAVLTCKDTETDKCLTPSQVTALKKLYAGAHDASGQIFPGFLPGAEEGEGGWATWITGQAPGRALLFFFGNGYFANMIYEKADWNYKTADLSEAIKASDQKGAKILNAIDPDLAPFKNRGGRLIIYHGWNDPAISALSTVNYYKQVQSRMGAQSTDSFLRLYMVPGMQHCGGGPGAASFNIGEVQLALEDWVEKGAAPSKLIAATKSAGTQQSETKITRPVCPYPQAAKYKGTGDPNSAENFECVSGAR
ncbi:MAG TPA: tannase/feruloyl esterase family alpha/beta hydrolase, partial [Terriglobales bacterium]|nr:tannase/feruloyl esterase family alpha/beta hydrolase [Terriglobales bacterium]